MDNYLNVMSARREQILERFYAALDRAGRPRDAARLIAVSKTVGVDETIAAIQVGYRHFAENRPQELVRKLTGLAEHPELPEVRFDMIGNLQTNKINAVLGSAELIHSVSSLHLAQAISSRAVRKIEAGELSGPQRVLVEVNVSGEESKGGFSPDEVRDAAGELGERIAGAGGDDQHVDHPLWSQRLHRRNIVEYLMACQFLQLLQQCVHLIK